MSVTAWRHRILLITTDRNLGDSFFKAFSPNWEFEGDNFTENGVQLTPAGWALMSAGTDQMVGVIDALNEGADSTDPRLDFMRPGRMNAATWDNAKLNIIASYWTAWQPDGTFVDQPDALDNFITANGFTRA